MEKMDNEVNIFEEIDRLKIASIRVVKRIGKTLKTLFKKPGKAISAASENAAEAKAIYRLLGNEKFKEEKLIEAHKSVVVEKIEKEKIKVILAPQDTSDLNFTGLKATKGLGEIGDSKNKAKGLIMHTSIALTEEGVPLGILYQKIWAREGYKKLTSTEKKNMPIEEKESYKWLETIDNATKDIPSDVRVVNICDREGDIYELFARAEEKKQEFLVRAVHNRKTASEEKLFESIRNMNLAGTIKVAIPRDTRNKRPERCAELSIRYKKVQLKKPDYLKKYPNNIETTIILVEERNPPEGIEPISWYLLTNAKVETFEDAVLTIKWYVQRWKIERFHYVLKSGCKVEDIQSSTVDRIKKLITLLSIVAIYILTITYFAREYPDTSCEEFFTEEEWKVLYCTANKTTTLPETIPTIKEAVFYLALLGGFLGRKCDKEPGAEVIWRGLHDFNVIMRHKKFL